jgi:hypothetical protein
MVHPSPAIIPKPGDLILRRATDGSRRYTVSPLGDAPQIVCDTYQEAAVQSNRFARTHHLNVWQTDDDHTFRRIGERRLASSA